MEESVKLLFYVFKVWIELSQEQSDLVCLKIRAPFKTLLRVSSVIFQHIKVKVNSRRAEKKKHIMKGFHLDRFLLRMASTCYTSANAPSLTVHIGHRASIIGAMGGGGEGKEAAEKLFVKVKGAVQSLRGRGN